MGKYDSCMKEYLQSKEHFADLFNGCCFQGRKVVEAEKLEEASETYVISKDDGSGSGKSQSFRDLKMRLGSGMLLQVLAIENQSYVDYGMPVRCMDYDTAEYKRQLKEKKQQFRHLLKQLQNNDHHTKLTITYAERLSGLSKKERLCPVYTICIYSGMDPWDGPRKLSDMMSFKENDEWKALFADYPVRLYCVNEENDFNGFHTELKELLQAMKCRKDKEKLSELMKNEAYTHLSKDTWQAIAIMTDNAHLIETIHSYRTENEKREEYNMCQALEELMQDHWNEGKEEGREESRQNIVLNMLKKGFQIEQICDIVECDPDMVLELQKQQKLLLHR